MYVYAAATTYTQEHAFICLKLAGSHGGSIADVTVVCRLRVWTRVFVVRGTYRRMPD